MRASGGSNRRSLPLWQALRTSLLAIPFAYLGGAVVVVIALYVVGRTAASQSPSDQGVLARDLLPAIGTATLTLAGFVLTITTLSIQFTATSYAPRLVEPLRRDRVLQHTLGVALATFVFSFGALLGVGNQGEISATAAVGVAMAGAAATVLLFIALLDRLTDRLRPGRMMRRVADDGLRVGREVYDPRDGQTDGEGEDRVPDRVAVDGSALPSQAVVRWQQGYGPVVAVAHGELRDLAADRQRRIELTLPVGAFVQPGDPIAVLRREDGAAVDEVPDDLGHEILGRIVVQPERTPDADPAYALRLLVDTALRALSPGVNDPTTASQALQHLVHILAELGGRRLGPVSVCDDDGAPRVLAPAPGWNALVDLAFTEIVHAGDDPQTARALVQHLGHLTRRLPADRRDAIAPFLERAHRRERELACTSLARP